jgi:membrane protein required for colicin V production
VISSVDIERFVTQQWLDLLVVGWLVWRAIAGFKNGFFMEASRMVGVVLGFTLGARFAGQVATTLGDYLLITPNITIILAYLLVVVVVILVANAVGRFATGLTSLLFLGWFNHLLGAVIGLAIGAAMVQTMVLFLATLKLKTILIAAPATIRFVTTIPIVTTVLPDTLVHPITPFINMLETLYSTTSPS